MPSWNGYHCFIFLSRALLGMEHALSWFMGLNRSLVWDIFVRIFKRIVVLGVVMSRALSVVSREIKKVHMFSKCLKIKCKCEANIRVVHDNMKYWLILQKWSSTNLQKQNKQACRHDSRAGSSMTLLLMLLLLWFSNYTLITIVTTFAKFPVLLSTLSTQQGGYGRATNLYYYY